MGACTERRAFGPGMAFAIAVATIFTSVPAFAGSSKDKSKKEPDPVVVWVSSELRPKGVTDGQPVTICVTGQTLSWTEGKKSYTLAIPDATVSFRPWEEISQTWYGGGVWDTSVPSAQAKGKTFVSGLAVTLPAGLPRNVTNVKWRATFESDMPGITVQWRWSAAAYSRLAADYNALKVKVAASGGISAGTPVAFGKFLLDAADDDDDDDDCGHGHHHDHDDDSDMIAKSEMFQASAPVTGFCGGAY